VVRRCAHDDVTRKTIHLKQEAADDTLDLARLVRVSAFLRDGVELIQEEHAMPPTDVLEDGLKPCACLTQVTGNDLLVPKHEKRQSELRSECLRD
jgi:hypothetical protein